MIDTVCLLIPKDKMIYLAGASSWELYSKTEQYEKYVRNPSKVEKETGKYFPRLTGYKRKSFIKDTNIRIEFSVPKLLYLNNLDELEEKDFPKVVATLQDRLKTMGVIVSKTVLENASISSVHFSKNIKLEDGYTANHLISEMSKIDLRKSFDFARTKYTNDGQSLYIHANSHQLVVYDKIADLGKETKRAIDKEQTMYQRNLFDELQKSGSTEIIRFEIRLSQKQKMNTVLEDLGYTKNPTFRDVFNAGVSKKVINSYWQTLIKEKNLGLFAISFSIKDTLQKILLSNEKIKPKQAIYLLGLFMLAKDENGMRQLRSIVSKRSNDRSWYRIAKDMQGVGGAIGRDRIRDWVQQIDKSLDDFKAYKHKELSTQTHLQCKAL